MEGRDKTDEYLLRSREFEQEVLDILDGSKLTAPEGRGSEDIDR